MKTNGALHITSLAFNSAANFARMVLSSRLHLRKDRLGNVYRVDDGGMYSIFRESVSALSIAGQGVVLVVGFRLKLLGSSRFFHWLFQRVCILTTPFWSGFRGFGTKLWMVDPKCNYVGIYQWADEPSARIYVDALARVLRALSIRDSVWYRLYPHTKLDEFLEHNSLDWHSNNKMPKRQVVT